ncbi:MAG: DNA gyrase subunit A [Zetaproteobacteria bacterium CG12_big_fil_rev_8_21_14_0_65_55_1124]|nr:MAG: DNA gyrase subunit A [Zetaproteobacteria bacterium CG1_02_55_237]PIS20459.1 MAG: DNA gyrase subunit A [Zetaproteobacteria bacterium CG08_land_8_20_14_0_20_55_17]PIW43738.1 MAG: DNA gyrase subunit A [Zetaproteobacteria bacterium CG12_big_fil_rev_8_21_14_0_65_55_1124]PIY53274.1 MAG: DNA gyrase subunit A [Zetaproteobacteria bacterium CG_4_10_14_0_8_um_filter_55_43]PIZ40154.1 MAG: DNA gyrase subunit A [Zetaproteobacteria bacterium CG_4_10_14_0_2_um_filter_55_20]PJB82158.1 MAG: DNA gyrase s
MEQQLDTSVPIQIEEEMRRSYLDYAMSVIIGRALPDARDGLKPVHRRILFAMQDLGSTYDKPFKKSARVVGDVIGKYHPHGDTAVYDAMVRMAQPWSMRHLLIDGQGNFGSVDGDSPAAMRYTEARMSRLSAELLADIDKNTVDFAPNYDESLQEPKVLPARFPNLLVNGSQGIAVGMATNIPPHNLAESINATIAMIEQPGISDETLMKIMPGPDFPTGGFIYGRKGMRDAFLTGRGSVTMRAKAMVEIHPRTKRESLIISELPYQVNKATLIENIAGLVRDKKLEGISDLRDESDRDGLRIAIELKRNEIPEVVLNNLYKHTQLQCNFSCNMLALVDGRPRLCGVREFLDYFIDHRRQVVTRRCLFELDKAQARAHILEGLLIALDHIDEVIKLIRASQTAEEARDGLMTHFGLSELQARAILDMRLQRLTGLERDKIKAEFDEVQATIGRLKAILADEKLLMQVIVEELQAVRDQYADARRSEIMDETAELSVEDLITEEDMVVTISNEGYIKRNAVSLYRAQRRGGKGKTAMTTKDEDFVAQLMTASTHDYLLFFSDRGRVFRKKVYEVPQAGRAARGKALVNLLPVEKDERISATLAVRDFDDAHYIVMATKKGVVKKTLLTDYANIRANGIIAIKLDEDDDLIAVRVTNGQQEIMLASSGGKAIRFAETDVRPMGRATRGVTGMRMAKGNTVIAMALVVERATLLAVSENGYGKRTAVEEYASQKRGGQGVFTLKTGGRNGSMVAALQVTDEDQVMMMTDSGRLVRIRLNGVSVIGRNTQGVKLIDCSSDEKVIGAVRVVEQQVDDVEGMDGSDEDFASDEETGDEA